MILFSETCSPTSEKGPLFPDPLYQPVIPILPDVNILTESLYSNLYVPFVKQPKFNLIPRICYGSKNISI